MIAASPFSKTDIESRFAPGRSTSAQPSRWLATLIALNLAIAAFISPERCIATDSLVIRPQPKPGPLDNPLKGWCPYTDAGEIHQPYSMVFQYISWRELEPAEGDFRFEDWERKWEVPAAKDKHIIFRVYIDYPSLPSGLPEWLRTSGVDETRYTDHGGGRSPNYDDPRLVEKMERFIAALGERYNTHPRIAFIQLGLLGYWGEWHTWPNEELYASVATETRVIAAYRKAFPDKSLMVRYARDTAGKQDWIGFHDDMFPEDTDNGEAWSFLSGVRRAGRTENWKRAVVGGEMVPNAAKKWLGPEYDTTLEMLEKSHFTWIGPYCPPLEATRDETFRNRSEELVRRMGYEFQLREISLPETLKPNQLASLTLCGTNHGVAPFYYPWSVEWALLDSQDQVVAIHKTSWDPRRWLPGDFREQTALNFDVPPGNYRLAIGIRDPWKDQPTIGFANEGEILEGWTIITALEVSE